MPREERERRYVVDCLQHFYPRGGWSVNVPLGPIPDDILGRHGVLAGARLYRPSRLRVDAVYPAKDAYYLIEAKIRSPRDAIGNLMVYLELAKKTPDLPDYTGQPLKAKLFVPWSLDWIRAMATAQGFEVMEWVPAWVEEYVRERQLYFTRDYRVAREEKLRLRRTLGVE